MVVRRQTRRAWFRATHGGSVTGTGVFPPIPRKYGDPVGPIPVSPRPRKTPVNGGSVQARSPVNGDGDPPPRNFAVKSATAAAAPPRHGRGGPPRTYNPMSEIHTPDIACHVLFGFVSQATMLSCHGLREGSEEERGKKKEEGKNGARALSLARKAHPASHPRRLTPCPMRVPGPFPSCRPPGSAVCAARSIAASV